MPMHSSTRLRCKSGVNPSIAITVSANAWAEPVIRPRSTTRRRTISCRGSGWISGFALSLGVPTGVATRRGRREQDRKRTPHERSFRITIPAIFSIESKFSGRASCAEMEILHSCSNGETKRKVAFESSKPDVTSGVSRWSCDGSSPARTSRMMYPRRSCSSAGRTGEPLRERTTVSQQSAERFAPPVTRSVARVRPPARSSTADRRWNGMPVRDPCQRAAGRHRCIP